MSQSFWVDNVLERLSRDVARATAQMERIVKRPLPRRPPLRTVIQQAVRDPGTIDYMGRQYLLSRLRERYGDMAEFVAPYIVPEPEQGSEQEVSYGPSV